MYKTGTELDNDIHMITSAFSRIDSGILGHENIRDALIKTLVTEWFDTSFHYPLYGLSEVEKGVVNSLMKIHQGTGSKYPLDTKTESETVQIKSETGSNQWEGEHTLFIDVGKVRRTKHYNLRNS